MCGCVDRKYTATECKMLDKKIENGKSLKKLKSHNLAILWETKKKMMSKKLEIMGERTLVHTTDAVIILVSDKFLANVPLLIIDMLHFTRAAKNFLGRVNLGVSISVTKT